MRDHTEKGLTKATSLIIFKVSERGWGLAYGGKTQKEEKMAQNRGCSGQQDYFPGAVGREL